MLQAKQYADAFDELELEEQEMEEISDEDPAPADDESSQWEDGQRALEDEEGDLDSVSSESSSPRLDMAALAEALPEREPEDLPGRSLSLCIFIENFGYLE